MKRTDHNCVLAGNLCPIIQQQSPKSLLIFFGQENSNFLPGWCDGVNNQAHPSFWTLQGYINSDGCRMEASYPWAHHCGTTSMLDPDSLRTRWSICQTLLAGSSVMTISLALLHNFKHVDRQSAVTVGLHRKKSKKKCEDFCTPPWTHLQFKMHMCVCPFVRSASCSLSVSWHAAFGIIDQLYHWRPGLWHDDGKTSPYVTHSKTALQHW